jgi:hypothetical protein
LCDDERRRNSSVIEERVEVLNMIRKPIFNAWLPRLAEPNQIRRDAMRYWCDQRKDIPPYVGRSRVTVQKERHWCFGVSGFPIGHRGTENIYLG